MADRCVESTTPQLCKTTEDPLSIEEDEVKVQALLQMIRHQQKQIEALQRGIPAARPISPGDDPSVDTSASKQFGCTEYPPCNLSFVRREELVLHIQEHTGYQRLESGHLRADVKMHMQNIEAQKHTQTRLSSGISPSKPRTKIEVLEQAELHFRESQDRSGNMKQGDQTPSYPGMADSVPDVGPSATSMRDPRSLTAAELHLELEKEQEAVVTRLTKELSALRSISNSIPSGESEGIAIDRSVPSSPASVASSFGSVHSGISHPPRRNGPRSSKRVSISYSDLRNERENAISRTEAWASSSYSSARPSLR